MEELISQALQEDMHIVVLALYVLGTVLKQHQSRAGLPDPGLSGRDRDGAGAFWWRAACRA